MNLSMFLLPWRIGCIVLLSYWIGIPIAHAQYFGKNKPKYSRQPFEVLETEHIEWYHYLQKNRPLLDRLAMDAEIWHSAHSRLFKDSLQFKNPIVLYNDHADFQQTNTIFGQIDPSTGGVTEALKNRVIIPLAFTRQQTHHVLGHELVHAFQFQAIQQADSTDLDNLRNIPLWLIEGMAEYFSLGKIDPHTAMWMRDAVLHDDIPSISEMSVFLDYFPYRFGHAFMAFLGSVYGDEIIVPLFKRIALVGLDQACKDLLGADLNSVSTLWVAFQKRNYTPWLQDSLSLDLPPLLSSLRWIRSYNQMAPAISPNGKYVIFLSDMTGLSMDLFLAETRTGDILHKIHSSDSGNDIDNLQFLESSGTWSPDNRHFAFVAFQHGKNVIVTVDVQKPKRKNIISINGLQAFTQPAWSPDGKSILLTGMKNGQTDLYLYTLRNKKLTALTQNEFSEIHASWSPDGQFIYYSSDEVSTPHNKYSFQMCRIRADGSEKSILDIFSGANNLNPQVDTEGNVYFLSDRDGFRQLYRLNAQLDQVEQMTHFQTGISGLTPYTPAISLSREAGNPALVFSLFNRKMYSLHTQTADKLMGVEVDRDDVHFSAGRLAPKGNEKPEIVQKQLHDWKHITSENTDAMRLRRPYKSRLGLDYIGGGTGMGVNTSSAFGANTALVGGIDMLFSDMLGDHVMFAGIAMNGEILDAGGMIQYLNRKNRLFWAINASHIPFRSGALFYKGPVNIIDEWGNTLPAIQYDLLVNRLFQDQINGMIQYPFSVNRRMELGLGYARFYERRDLISQYYNEFGQFIGQERYRIPSPGSLDMFNNMIAYVGDNAKFGIASPLHGWRYRLAAEAFWGDLQYQTTLLDFRRYVSLYPYINLALRTIQYSRLGRDKDRLFPLYTIDPMLVRGYQRLSLDDLRRDFQLESSQISGSNLWVGNIECRIPLSGHPKMARIPSRLFLTELAWFADAGVAWSQWGDFTADHKFRPALITSTGISLRINLFGALILEPYYAFILNRRSQITGCFGINLIPGW
jgi:hypothetical protein